MRVLLLAALLTLSVPRMESTPLARPTSRFTYKCDPAPALRCTFTSTSLGLPNRFTWSWGDGRSEVHTQSTASNVWAAPGTYTVRLTVTDSIGGSSYSTQKITVPVAKASCSCVDTVIIYRPDTTTKPPVVPPPVPPSGEVWAELPRVYLDTKMPATTGKVISVAAGGDLQAALNAAQPCDAIELANSGTWTGAFTLPNKAGSCWIVIRPANMTTLPPEGTRLSPATAGRLPRIVAASNQGAIATDVGAHHWRLVGLEVVPSVANTGLIRLGSSYESTLAQLPHDVVLDRVYVHGTATGNNRRCVALNGAAMAVIDSYIADCHEQGADAQAIAGWNGPGPFRISNNYLEASGENILFGGADPLIPGLIPSDVEIRGNHITKPPAWRGGPWLVKNLFEMKNAQRVLLEGNVLENNWQDGQGGSAVVLKSVNQSGGCPWCVAKDITVRRNLIRNTGSGFALTGHDVGAQSVMTRITITDNLLIGIDAAPFNGDGRGFLINNDPIDLVIAHNTVLDATNTAVTFGGPATEPPQRLVFRDNIVDGGQYGVKGPGLGTAAALATFAPSGLRGNLIITPDPTGLPAGTAVPTRAAIGFAANWQLSATSPFRGKATTGRDPGADIGAVLAALRGVVQP